MSSFRAPVSVNQNSEVCSFTSSELLSARSVWSRSVFRGHSAAQTAEEKSRLTMLGTT